MYIRTCSKSGFYRLGQSIHVYTCLYIITVTFTKAYYFHDIFSINNIAEINKYTNISKLCLNIMPSFWLESCLSAPEPSKQPPSPYEKYLYAFVCWL